MMSWQTGVNPVHIQAARKAQKKQREKANGSHNSPLEVCAKVSPPFLSSLSFVDSVNMQYVSIMYGLVLEGLKNLFPGLLYSSDGWRFSGLSGAERQQLNFVDSVQRWQKKILSPTYECQSSLVATGMKTDIFILIASCWIPVLKRSVSVIGSSTRSREWPMRFCPLTTWRRSRGTASWGTDAASPTWRRPSSSNLSALSTPSSWTGRLPPSLTLWEPKPSNRFFFSSFFATCHFQDEIRYVI